MRIGVVAGEASGDILGAGLLRELKQRYPDAVIEGIGGPLMQQAGCRSLFPQEKLAVMGLTEILAHLREILAIRRQLLQHFIASPPDVFIGIDAPEFNTGLELKLHQRGIPTVHYVSPSVWAWRQYRIKKIARAVDLMLTLFPFESGFYRQHNIRECFVGHPLANSIPLEDQRDLARDRLGIDTDATVIAILPGSRMGEIKVLLADFLATAAICHQRQADIRFLIAAAHQRAEQAIREALGDAAFSDLDVTIIRDASRDVMAAADSILLASGTATLEAMLLKRPMVVAYRVSAMTAWIARRFLQIDTFALPNLLADKALVREFIQEAIDPEAMAGELLTHLREGPERQHLLDAFTELHRQLRHNADRRAADAIDVLLADRRAADKTGDAP